MDFLYRRCRNHVVWVGTYPALVVNKMTNEQFAEIKERYEIVSGAWRHSKKDTEITEVEMALVNKWKPFDIQGMLINHVDAQAETIKELDAEIERLNKTIVDMLYKADAIDQWANKIEVEMKEFLK